MTEWKKMIYKGRDLGNYYLISNHGEIKSIKTNHIRKLSFSDRGYLICVISLGSRSKKICARVHRAVAETFIPNPDNLPEVNHLDGDKSNNVVSNLEWCSSKENTRHAVKNGLRVAAKGERCYTAKLTNDDVEYIRNVYVPRDRDYGLRALARKFGVYHTTIEDIVKDVSWKR